MSKVRTAFKGSRYGGQPLARGALYLMLQNRIYRGEIVHKGEGQRIPAVALESLVVRRIRDWLADPAAILQAIQHAASDAVTQRRLIERARNVGAGEIDALHTFMRSSIVRAQVHADRIDIILDQARVCECLGEVAKQTTAVEKPQSEGNGNVTTLSIPARLKRTGKEMRIVVSDGSEPATPDTGLVRLLVRANAIRDQLLADRSRTFEDIAKAKASFRPMRRDSFVSRCWRLTSSARSSAADIRRS